MPTRLAVQSAILDGKRGRGAGTLSLEGHL